MVYFKKFSKVYQRKGLRFFVCARCMIPRGCFEIYIPFQASHENSWEQIIVAYIF